MERKWAIIIAAILGLLAVFLTNFYFQQKEARLQLQRGKEVQVLVAAKDISRGTTIEYDMLAFKLMPINFIQPGVLQSKESAVGKTALGTIMAGEQVLATKLATPGTGLTLAGKTPPGKRAFTVSLDAASTVGGMVRPGDHVDVLAVFIQPPVTLTLFQDILVLAVGEAMVAEQKERAGWREKAPSSVAKGNITFALSPQEVQILTVAMQHGKINLTLRPRMESGEALPQVDLSQLPPAIDLNTLFQIYIGGMQEMAPPPPTSSVEVIRGLEKEDVPMPANQ